MDLRGVFVYGTGNSFTPIKSLYLIENNLMSNMAVVIVPELLLIIELDISATLTPKPFSEKTIYIKLDFFSL